MKPHQLRVIEEKRELDDKRKKLDTFIGSEKFKAIPLEERWRLTRQASHMMAYSDVLGERIKAFEK